MLVAHTPTAIPLPDADVYLPECYASLAACITWMFFTGHPLLGQLLDELKEQERALDQATDLGLIPIPRQRNNYGERTQWVLDRLGEVAGPGCHPALARFRRLHEGRFRYLPPRH